MVDYFPGNALFNHSQTLHQVGPHRLASVIIVSLKNKDRECPDEMKLSQKLLLLHEIHLPILAYRHFPGPSDIVLFLSSLETLIDELPEDVTVLLLMEVLLRSLVPLQSGKLRFLFAKDLAFLGTALIAVLCCTNRYTHQQISS